MKTPFLSLFILLTSLSFSQTKNKNYSNTQIEITDILDALELNGIQIHKFNLEKLDKKYNINFVIEEFENGELQNTDTLYGGNNLLIKPKSDVNNTDDYFEIRVISKELDNECKLSINVKGDYILERKFKFKKTYARQFFKWRSYTETNWKINKKTPLMAYISSSIDRGYIRWCCPDNLKEDNEDSIKCLSRSPNYFILSIITKEVK